MTIDERNRQNMKMLSEILGENYAVLNWKYNAFYCPDFVTIAKLPSGKTMMFRIEPDHTEDSVIMELHKEFIVESFANF